LDGICLQAWGHPHDYGVRQELLSALEWDHSLDPGHARPAIRDLFRQVHDRSVELSRRIRSATGQPDAVIHAITHGTHDLRQSLAALIQALKNRHHEAPKG
jgi:hypothetical protein